MKREIKFRRLYYYPDDGSSSWVIKQIMPDGNWREELPMGPFEEKSPWLQFTGLRDKNGKEIYDGDVVIGESHQRKPYAIVSDVGGLVVMEIGELACMKRGHYYLCEAVADHQTTGWLQNCEVIGNIHENPELLS